MGVFLVLHFVQLLVVLVVVVRNRSHSWKTMVLQEWKLLILDEDEVQSDVPRRDSPPWALSR